MAYIKFDLEKNKDFLLKPEGKKFLVYVASTSDNCEALEKIIEFQHTPARVLAIIVKRFTESEKDKWFGNVKGYYILDSIADDIRINAEILKTMYEYVDDAYNYYLNNATSYPSVLVNIIKRIAEHPNASEGLIRKLLASNYDIMEEVASNKGISDELLIQVLNNTSSDRVKDAALEQLWERCPSLRPQCSQNK